MRNVSRHEQKYSSIIKHVFLSHMNCKLTFNRSTFFMESITVSSFILSHPWRQILSSVELNWFVQERRVESIQVPKSPFLCCAIEMYNFLLFVSFRSSCSSRLQLSSWLPFSNFERIPTGICGEPINKLWILSLISSVVKTSIYNRVLSL